MSILWGATSHYYGLSTNYNSRFRPRIIRADPNNFHVCPLSKRHLGSIALALGVITLLLVIFAYHGGHGIGSWFYSLIMVVSGLVFMVFGPLLLCRFVVHAYYRQIETTRRSVPIVRRHAESQTNRDGRNEEIYSTCMLFNNLLPLNGGYLTSRSDLPTYEEATTTNDLQATENTELCTSSSVYPNSMTSKSLALMHSSVVDNCWTENVTDCLISPTTLPFSPLTESVCSPITGVVDSTLLDRTIRSSASNDCPNLMRRPLLSPPLTTLLLHDGVVPPSTRNCQERSAAFNNTIDFDGINHCSSLELIGHQRSDTPPPSYCEALILLQKKQASNSSSGPTYESGLADVELNSVSETVEKLCSINSAEKLTADVASESSGTCLDSQIKYKSAAILGQSNKSGIIRFDKRRLSFDNDLSAELFNPIEEVDFATSVVRPTTLSVIKPETDIDCDLRYGKQTNRLSSKASHNYPTTSSNLICRAGATRNECSETSTATASEPNFDGNSKTTVRSKLRGRRCFDDVIVGSLNRGVNNVATNSRLYKSKHSNFESNESHHINEIVIRSMREHPINRQSTSKLSVTREFKIDTIFHANEMVESNKLLRSRKGSTADTPKFYTERAVSINHRGVSKLTHNKPSMNLLTSQISFQRSFHGKEIAGTDFHACPKFHSSLSSEDLRSKNFTLFHHENLDEVVDLSLSELQRCQAEEVMGPSESCLDDKKIKESTAYCQKVQHFSQDISFLSKASNDVSRSSTGGSSIYERFQNSANVEAIVNGSDDIEDGAPLRSSTV